MTQAPLSPVSLAGEAADPQGFARALGESFAAHGFAIVRDHGLDEGLIAATLADARALFALPEAVKARYRVAGGAGQRGFTPFAVETAKGAAHADLKEFWHVGRETGPTGNPRRDNVWPEEVPAFRGHALALWAGLEACGKRLLAAIGRHLGAPAGCLEGAVEGGDSILRLLHYPPAPPDGEAVRAGAHEDINAITLLLGAEEAGLELKSRDGRWLAVAPPPGALVVNIGDMLARMTGGALPSTTHRVVNPAPERRGAARYSTPFFLHFRPDFVIETLPSCRRPGAASPPPISAADYLAERLAEIRLA